MTERMFAFLRAINTGNRRLTNDELIEPFRRLGLDDVEAYQAAGNVTFRSDADTDSLATQIEAALGQSYGFDAPTFVRTGGEIDRIVAGQPFTTDQLDRTEGRIQVTFTRGVADAATRAALDELVSDDDLVMLDGDVWYWLPRAGVSESSLPVGRIESLLGPMTMRTLGTVERMRRRFS